MRVCLEKRLARRGAQCGCKCDSARSHEKEGTAREQHRAPCELLAGRRGARTFEHQEAEEGHEQQRGRRERQDVGIHHSSE